MTCLIGSVPIGTIYLQLQMSLDIIKEEGETDERQNIYLT